MIEEPGVINLVIKNGEWHWSSYFSNLKSQAIAVKICYMIVKRQRSITTKPNL